MSEKSQNMSFPQSKFSGKLFYTLVGFKVVYFEMPNKNIGAELFACLACGIVTLLRFRWGRVAYPRGEGGLIHVGFALHPYSDWLLQLILTKCEKWAALKIATSSGRRKCLGLSAVRRSLLAAPPLKPHPREAEFHQLRRLQNCSKKDQQDWYHDNWHSPFTFNA